MSICFFREHCTPFKRFGFISAHNILEKVNVSLAVFCELARDLRDGMMDNFSSPGNLMAIFMRPASLMTPRILTGPAAGLGSSWFGFGLGFRCCRAGSMQVTGRFSSDQKPQKYSALRLKKLEDHIRKLHYLMKY
jgi:hypothetical protein